MSLITLFDHLFNFDASSSKRVQNAIEVYAFVWFGLQAVFWLSLGAMDIIEGAAHVLSQSVDPLLGIAPPSSWGFINYMPILQGFSLVEYFPPLLRLIVLVFIYGSLIGIPFTILAFILGEIILIQSR